MNSRTKTKSFDVSSSSQSKKFNQPISVQEVYNEAEHLICDLHNKVEHIFEMHPVVKFEQELDPDKVSNYISGISSEIDVDSVMFSKLNQLIRIKCNNLIKANDLHDLVSSYLDFVLSCDNLFKGIAKQLADIVLHGLLRYCISLAQFCASDIECVIDYEKVIQKNKGDIIRDIKDVEYQTKELERLTNSSRLVLIQVGDLISTVKIIRASINKLYYLVTEWIDEERNFSSNISDEMTQTKSELINVEERTKKNENSIKDKQMKIKSLEKKLKILIKNHLAYKRQLNHVKLSQSQIEIRLKELEDQTTSQDSELKSLGDRIKILEQKKNKPGKKLKTPRYKMSMEINAAKVTKQDFETKAFRTNNNRFALRRHKERLLSLADELRKNIDLIRSQITDNQLMKGKLKESLNEDRHFQQTDVDKMKDLQIKLKDITFIYNNKSSPDALRRLRNHSQMNNNYKELRDKLCDLTAKKILKNWKELYMHLPMIPNRTMSQRYHDIEVIDTISAKNDGTLEIQAKMCLNKWRLFYHNAKSEHLVVGLQKSNNNQLAKEIQIEIDKSNERYDEVIHEEEKNEN